MGVRLYLQGELKQLSGISGLGHDLPARANALNTLRDVVASLPQDVRLRITELGIGPTSIFIHGEARGFSDAEAVARRLKNAGFIVEAPRSERNRTGQGVVFSLTAKVGEPSSPGVTQAQAGP